MSLRKVYLIPFIFFFPFCLGQVGTSMLAEHETPELLADGFQFTEGPAADADGNIYFTDIGNDRIHHWDALKGKLSTVRENPETFACFLIFKFK